MKDRVYVCHTHYHVFVTILKELNLPREWRGQATLVLSSLSNDFEKIRERIESTGLFEEVVEFDEKRDDYFPQLKKWRQGAGNFIGNLWYRIRFTKEYADLEEEFIPLDFREYRDIYIYCDSDPIGYYLNQKRIPYHAMEDGLNCLKYFDMARYDNRKCFWLKVFLSRKCNLLFVQNGYGKYCIDMEVNDISAIKYPCPRYVEVPRQALMNSVKEEDKKLIQQVFVRDRNRLETLLEEIGKVEDKILILTNPVCSLEIRERIFRDVIAMFESQGQIFIKAHPRDSLNYGELFSEYQQFDAMMPMEVLNFFPGLRFKKVVSIFTEINELSFAEEIVRLGPDFMDRYEDPLIHRQNEQI